MLLMCIILFARASCITQFCPLYEDLELPECRKLAIGEVLLKRGQQEVSRRRRGEGRSTAIFAQGG